MIKNTPFFEANLDGAIKELIPTFPKPLEDCMRNLVTDNWTKPTVKGDSNGT